MVWLCVYVFYSFLFFFEELHVPLDVHFFDMHIVIRQDHDTFFDEVAQEERQFGPHFHHEGGKTCVVTGRQFSDPRSWYERPL